MYNAYFGFREKPFTIAPNPQFLFMSPRHQEALAHMLYGVRGEGGVMVLTGEVGTGKTTVCRHLLTQIPKNTLVAYIINPRQSETEMLASICDELHISCEDRQSIKALTDALNHFLLDNHAKGRHTVLVIDEAQNLAAPVLEQLRLLTNLETSDKKLLQIMLLGQPELADVLAREELRQLSQRVTSRYHLTPLNQKETGAYVRHRLEVAGCTNTNLFPASVIHRLHQYSGGVPRLINLIADRALLGAYALGHSQINRTILRQARDEVLGNQPAPRFTILAYAMLALGLLTGLWLWNMPSISPPAQPTAATQAIPKQAPTSPTPEPVSTAMSTVSTNKPVLPLTSQRQEAFIPVFAAWHITYQPTQDGDACTFAQKNGLRCLRRRDDLAGLRSLDRPAVLTVSNHQGKTAYTAVTALTGTTAMLATQHHQATIPLSQLALQSFNDFTLLWKAPQGYQGPVRPGQTGPLIAYLAEQVTQALHQSWIGAPRTRYDHVLKEQVKTLQRREGLTPDGVAGPITWIHLHRLNRLPAPSLHEEAL